LMAKTIEYMVHTVFLDGYSDDAKIRDALRGFGSDGWELVNALAAKYNRDGELFCTKLFLKRESESK